MQPLPPVRTVSLAETNLSVRAVRADVADALARGGVTASAVIDKALADVLDGLARVAEGRGYVYDHEHDRLVEPFNRTYTGDLLADWGAAANRALLSLTSRARADYGR